MKFEWETLKFHSIEIFLIHIFKHATESIICDQSRQDVMDGLYSGSLSVLSFSFASAPNDLLTFTSSILIIIFWLVNYSEKFICNEELASVQQKR